MKLPVHSYIWYAIVALGVTASLFCLTNAASVPSVIIILAFLLVAASIWGGAYAFFSFISLYGIKVTHKKRLSLYVAGFLAGILALQSIGELSQRDVSVLLPLVILGYLYSAYAKTSRRNLES